MILAMIGPSSPLILTESNKPPAPVRFGKFPPDPMVYVPDILDTGLIMRYPRRLYAGKSVGDRFTPDMVVKIAAPPASEFDTAARSLATTKN